MADPDRTRTRRRALGALAAVVAGALAVGGILAVGAYAAARMAGLTDNTGGHPAAAHGVAAPSRPPSATHSSAQAPTSAGSPSATAHQAARPAQQPATQKPSDGLARQRDGDRKTPHKHARPQHQHAQQARQHRNRHQHQHQRGPHQHRRPRAASGALTLSAARTRVRPMGRIDLAGRCGCRNGTRLVVQRLEHGRWARFPASATAYHGRFHTWVMTGRRGPNEFRVVLPGAGASDPVTVTVS